MGCSSEKCISGNSPKKKYHNENNLDKINHSNEDNFKDISNHQHNKNNFGLDEENDLENYNILNDIEDQDIKDENNNREKESEKENKEDEENKENEEEEEREEKEEKEEEEEEEDENNNNEEDINREMIRQLTPYLQIKVNPNFNLPEVKNNTYVGKGLKRMKGYISTVPKDELEKRRIAFWETRVEGDPLVWNFLKELCNLPEEETENISAMLEANEITPLKNCINVTYDKAGEVYEIPNYCINEPVSFDLPEMHMKKPEKKNVVFHVRKGAEQIKIKAYNNTSVEKVKSNISKKLNIDANNIRLFFRGKEMKNGNELWAYNIENDCVIILMYSG